MSAVAEPPTQTRETTEPPEAPLVPNKFCVVAGQPGRDPLTIIGPFDTNDEASDHAARHRLQSVDTPVNVDILIDPANC